MTRRERMLAETDAVIPWRGRLALNEPRHPRATLGRPPQTLTASIFESMNAWLSEKRLWGFAEVRYCGIARNLARAQTMFALASLCRVRRRLLPPEEGPRSRSSALHQHHCAATSVTRAEVP